MVNDSNNNSVIDTDMYHDDLDKLRKKIEKLSNQHHIEIAKIFKNNNIKLTENNNGIFIKLNNIPTTVIQQIKNYLLFISSQENLINIDENKKEILENKFFL
tara:strand:+ start:377 stop:682 length:306 start_codon:yes stop_codon:yes gene_type:complete